MQPPAGPVLTTPRLGLRPLGLADLDTYHAILTDADVRRFLLDDTVVSRDWVLEEIGRSDALFRVERCGTWLVTESGRDTAIGFGGFRHFYEPPELQLFYGLLPDYWGRGYATEASRAVVTYGFETLGFDSIVAATDPPNLASVRVLERLGMQVLGENVRDGLPALYFRLDRPG